MPSAQWLVTEFERLGYRWAYRVLDTIGFGLPQRRRRVYFVASRDVDPRTILFADETDQPDLLKPDLSLPLGFYWTEGKSGVGLTHRRNSAAEGWFVPGNSLCACCSFFRR